MPDLFLLEGVLKGRFPLEFWMPFNPRNHATAIQKLGSQASLDIVTTYWPMRGILTCFQHLMVQLDCVCMLDSRTCLLTNRLLVLVGCSALHVRYYCHCFMLQG